MNTSTPSSTRKHLSVPVILLIVIGAIAFLVICLVIVATILPGPKNNNLSAKLSEIVGVVDVKNTVQDPADPVNNGFVLKSAMQLQTMQDSKVRLDVSTGTIVRLGPVTIFSLDSQQAGSQGVLAKIQLQAGRAWIVLQGGSLDVNTPAGLASVRGSYMSVWVEPKTNRITVCCLEGVCVYQNKGGSVALTSGQKIVSSNLNIAPAVQPMDQTDIQSWLDNSPEGAKIVPQILSLMATSTPSVTPTSSPTDTFTPTETPSSTSTATITPSETPIPTSTATRVPTVIVYRPTWTNTPAPTKTPKPKPTRTPTPRFKSPIIRVTFLPIFIPTSTPTPGEIIY